MKFFVALCILITLQMSFIRATEEGEQNVEDHNVEVTEDYIDIDTTPGDLRAKPKLRPLCERTHRPGRGYGGQCLYPAELLNKSCCFIRNEVDGKELCYDEEKVCCGDCNTPILNRTCHHVAGHDTASRESCCPGELGRGILDIGCICCGKCKHHRCHSSIPRWKFCVAKYDVVKNFQYCKDLGCRVYPRRCKGRNCACCICPYPKP